VSDAKPPQPSKAGSTTKLERAPARPRASGASSSSAPVANGPRAAVVRLPSAKGVSSADAPGTLPPPRVDAIVPAVAVAVGKAGPGYVRLRVADPESPAARDVFEWLAGRDDVREVVRLAPSERDAEVEVRFLDEAPTPGAFVRSLRDRVFAATRPAPASFAVDVLHLLEGRVRLGLKNVSEDDVLRAAELARTLPGVVRVTPSPIARTILVGFDHTQTSARAILDGLARGDRTQWPEAPKQPPRRGMLHVAVDTAVFAAALTGAVPAPAMGAAVALTALPSAQRAFRALRDKRLSVDLLDLAAVGISVATGRPSTGAFITWLLAIGDAILEKTQDRARGAIAHALRLEATEAWVLHDGTTKRVSAKSLAKGDVLVVETGGAVAADGVVVRGSALVDEKALTGESVPRHKQVGDRVFAATVVVDGEVHVEVERVGTDTTAAKIVQILEGAGAKPMTLQRETERVADKLVLPTIGLAGLAGSIGTGLDAATSVLITDFGTGIRVGVPTATLAAITMAARAGVLVKGGQYLERLSKVDTIVFDKTGTLTGGSPLVVDVVTYGGCELSTVARYAAAAEQRQRHPVAEAIRAWALRLGLDVPAEEIGTVAYTVGMGVRARIEGREIVVGGARYFEKIGLDFAAGEPALAKNSDAGRSSVLVAIDDELAGVIALFDEPRDESRRVVQALRANGRREVVLMSGDAKAPVEGVARAVGVDRAYSGLLPEQKAEQVKALQREGRIVAMVGDGINDAPALALADVGISLEGGTDVALETADVVLLEGGLSKLPDAFDLADQAMKTIRRALGIVIVPNAVAIALGAVGLMPPTVAAIVNNGSTIAAALAGVAPLFLRRK
jgi:Cu2+-exporting ATPase